MRAHRVLRASLWLTTVHRRWTFVLGVYIKAGVLGVCRALWVLVELVFYNVRAHHVLRASLWLTPVHRRWTFVLGVYIQAGVFGVCRVP